MAAPEASLKVGNCDVILLGTIPGFVPDGERVAHVIQDMKPQTIAIGVPEEDLAALDQLEANPEAATDLEPDDLDMHLLTLLEHWGKTQAIPSPDLQAVKACGTELVAIDLDDDEHTTAFTDSVKVRHLVQRTSVRRRLAKDTGENADDAYHLVQQWDEALCKIIPLGAIEASRARSMVEGIQRASRGCRRLVAVVPSVRYAQVLKGLTS